MAVRDELLLDLSQALSAIDDLERQIDSLLQPVKIPVTLDDSQVTSTSLTKAEQATQELRQELGLTDDALADVRREADRTGRELETAGGKGTKAFKGLGTALLGVATGIAAFVGLREVTQFFNESIGAASDLAESTSKAQVVFGSFFDDIQAFASTAPQALGLANQKALEFTGTFGNLFTALGLSQRAAADLSPEVVQLGADLASFNNIDVTDALDKLRAGLVGESEPLRVLGVNLNAAATAAKAVELGLANSTSNVSEAAKVQARYALILEQTATAQGDFARTADGIANRQRTLTAEFDNFRASVGEALLPAFESLLDAAPSVLDALTDLVPVISDIANTFADFDVGKAVSGLRDFIVASQEVKRFVTGDFFGFTISKQLQDFDASVQAGIAPTRAFEATLADLFKTTNRDLGADEVARFVNELQEFARLDPAGLANVLANVTRFGASAGLSDIEVQALVSTLRELLGLSGELPPPVDEIRRALDDLPDSVNRSVSSLTDFGDSLSRVIPPDFSFDAQIANIREGLEGLPGAFDAASAAFQDQEGDLITDFTDFLDNLDAQLEQRAQFRRGVAILEALGLTDLAQTFRDEGFSAELNQVLQDAIANPLEATEANARIKAAAEQEARDYATAFGATVGQELANLDPVQFEVTPVLGALDTSGLNFLNLNVGVGGPGFGGGEPQIIINQTFDNTPSPTTETERAAQSVAAVVRS